MNNEGFEEGNEYGGENTQNRPQERFDQPVSYQPQSSGGTAPKEPKKHFGLAVASLVLGGLSLICCCCCGFGIIPAVIAVIFGLIGLIGGRDTNVRVMGGIGLALGILGIILNMYIIVTFVMLIDWSQLTPENLQRINDINPDNTQEIQDWMQQFFKIDLTPYFEQQASRMRYKYDDND